jgi:Family of unknown function (DUF6949)
MAAGRGRQRRNIVNRGGPPLRLPLNRTVHRILNPHLRNSGSKRDTRHPPAGHSGCIADLANAGDQRMYRDVMVVLFATTIGFTASAIVANLYRIFVKKKAEGTAAMTVYIAVMVAAGPSVLFENAARSRRAKGCSAFAFWLAAALVGYWSFALGLFVIELGLAL